MLGKEAISEDPFYVPDDEDENEAEEEDGGKKGLHHHHHHEDKISKKSKFRSLWKGSKAVEHSAKANFLLRPFFGSSSLSAVGGVTCNSKAKPPKGEETEKKCQSVPSNRKNQVKQRQQQQQQQNRIEVDFEAHFDRLQESSSSNFYDSSREKWVKIDNFAFDNADNHFSSFPANPDNMDAAAKLNRSTASESSILDAAKMKEGQFEIKSGDEEEIEKMFEEISHRNEDKIVPKNNDHDNPSLPKIVISPRNQDEEDEEAVIPEPRQKRNSASAIPRFMRNQHRSKSFSPSPVERRTITKSSTRGRFNHRAPPGRSHSSAHLSRMNLVKSPRSCSKSDGNLARISQTPFLAGKKLEFPHVESKVKHYIEDIKKLSANNNNNKTRNFNLSGGRKSQSLSNLAMESTAAASSDYNDTVNKMKSFLSASNLADLSITVTSDGGRNRISSFSMDRVDKTRISRLLDKLSDDDDREDEVDRGGDGEVTLEVEDVLALALEQRREKKEAEKVLSQLQENYDQLQRKFAEAENKIDKLR